MRLTDTDVLVEQLSDKAKEMLGIAEQCQGLAINYYEGAKYGFAKAAIIANCLPTIDAVPVVRCKECRFSVVNENIDRKPLICGKTKMCGETTPDWFCAAGKRREEDPPKPVWNEEWTRQ